MSNSTKEILMPNEKVIKKAKFSPVIFWKCFILLFILAVLFTDSGIRSEYFRVLPPFILVIIAFALPGIKTMISSVLILTDKRIYGKTGFIKTVELASPIQQIQNVQINRSFLGKIFCYGTISITTTTGVYGFKYIKRPNDFRESLMSQIENHEYDKMDIHAEKIANAIYRKNNE